MKSSAKMMNDGHKMLCMAFSSLLFISCHKEEEEIIPEPPCESQEMNLSFIATDSEVRISDLSISFFQQEREEMTLSDGMYSVHDDSRKFFLTEYPESRISSDREKPSLLKGVPFHEIDQFRMTFATESQGEKRTVRKHFGCKSIVNSLRERKSSDLCFAFTDDEQSYFYNDTLYVSFLNDENNGMNATVLPWYYHDTTVSF